MKLYHLSIGSTDAFNGELAARHAFGLPGVHCPLCGSRWASTGVAYPTVDVSALPQRDRIKTGNVPWAEFVELRELVRGLLPGRLPLPPGTGFGALRGKAKGNDDAFGSFVPLVPWTIVVRDRAARALAAAGLAGIRSAPVQLQFPSTALSIEELEVWPLVSLAKECLPGGEWPKACAQCGRLDLKAPERVVLDGATVPKLDIFRGAELSTYIFVTERFVEACESIQLTNLTVTEVAVT
jgi:uncharacterized double-CXXCG motif protein